MEINPAGVLILAVLLLVMVFVAALVLGEILAGLKIIKKADWSLRIVLTIGLFIAAIYFFYFKSCSGNKENDIITTTAAPSCNQVNRDKLVGNWVHWNVSHSKQDTLSLKNDGTMNWGERGYYNWILHCDTLIVKNKDQQDSLKILNVTNSNLNFRVFSVYDTGWQFSAVRVVRRK